MVRVQSGTEDGGSSFGDMASVGDYNMSMASLSEDNDNEVDKFEQPLDQSKEGDQLDGEEEVGQSMDDID